MSRYFLIGRATRKKFVFPLLALAAGLGACANHPMPTETQLALQNPHLAACDSGQTVTCKVTGGRTRKNFSNCGCSDYSR